MNYHAGAVAAGSWPGTGRIVQRLDYDGTVGALYWIFIKTLLLSVVTLGFYRFWGKAALRRYAWSRITLQHERFQYSGTGGELLQGFLLVILLWALVLFALAIATVMFGQAVGSISRVALPILVVYLLFVGSYAAQKYRLARTWWCGIRGGMTGSPWLYGLKALVFSALNVATLNLSLPWTTARLIEHRFTNSYFGDLKASLRMSVKPLYGPFLLGFVGAAVAMGVLGFALWLWGSNIDAFNIRVAGENTIIVPPSLVGLAVVAYLAGSLILIIAFAAYKTAMLREIADNLRIAELRFSSEINSGLYAGFWIGNLLWLTFTLGLGFPVVIHRSLNFFAHRLSIHGALDAAHLQQNTLERPEYGEGLLEAFDPSLL